MSHLLEFKAVRHLRTLLSLILTNSEVRKLLSDFSVVGRDLLARGAAKAAEALRPDREALSRVDEPAPEGEFVSEGRKTGTGETPVLDVDIPHADVHVEHQPHPDEPMFKMSRGEEASGRQAPAEGQQAVRPAQELAVDIGKQATEQAQRTSQKAKEVAEPRQ